MKREILCLSCAKRTAQTITGFELIDSQIVDPYPGEHAKFKEGVLVRHCLCDACGGDLEPNMLAVAMSIWSDHGGTAYYPWESEFFGMIGVDK